MGGQVREGLAWRGAARPGFGDGWESCTSHGARLQGQHEDVRWAAACREWVCGSGAGVTQGPAQIASYWEGKEKKWGSCGTHAVTSLWARLRSVSALHLSHACPFSLVFRRKESLILS